MNLQEFLKSMVTSNTGISSKRTISVIFAFNILIIAYIDLFTDFNISSNVFDGLMWVVGFGLGATALEKFSNKLPKKEEKEPEI